MNGPSALATSTAASDDLLGVELDVLRVVQETPEAVSIVFDADATSMPYLPGQYLTVRVPSDQTGAVARCYSLSSSPHLPHPLTITVKRTAGGYASNWLCDHVEAGTRLRVLPPAGRFVLDAAHGPLSLYGAGSGITPLLSIATSALHSSRHPVALFYANRDRRGIIFARELERLETTYAGRLSIVHWDQSTSGLPTGEAVAAFAADSPDSDAYLCGPEPFMHLVERTLRRAHGGRAVHLERFRSLEADPFAPVGTAGSAVTTPGAERTEAAGAVVRVSLQGTDYRFTCPPDDVLLDAMLRERIPAPYSCRDGECGSCMTHLLRGSVATSESPAASQEDIDDGYVLACRSRPTSPEVDIDSDV